MLGPSEWPHSGHEEDAYGHICLDFYSHSLKLVSFWICLSWVESPQCIKKIFLKEKLIMIFLYSKTLYLFQYSSENIHTP